MLVAAPGYAAPNIEMVRRGFGLSGDRARQGPVVLQAPFQILGMPIFDGFLLAAVLNRRRAAVHNA